ncbi:hypothetical protein NFX46_22020 [Streptomyces phaeoluteigriseus]|uniref:Uncharacterized protein n=1 Tax=Streptomyces phaeoluteigriseus TaxID=114686 RepID=A0ABY4ZCT1_9ACTN|nr:hypothetical protein [Streptomyces phaeoluteigriseus]USQ86142.1 hypothetical protein NFX46_22020 [Streptomyces phaeoluteigriseus]
MKELEVPVRRHAVQGRNAFGARHDAAEQLLIPRVQVRACRFQVPLDLRRRGTPSAGRAERRCRAGVNVIEEATEDADAIVPSFPAAPCR